MTQHIRTSESSGAGWQKGVAVLGSTGSIGQSTLDVIRRHPERFRVVSLAAGNNAALALEQAHEFTPELVSVATDEAASAIRDALPAGCRVAVGTDGASEAATLDSVDTVVAAIAGAAGLVPTVAGIRAGKDIALANKETLVMGGEMVMRMVTDAGSTLLPVDSEHSAVFQSLAGHRACDVKRVILTASGGPFLNSPLGTLADMTPEEALNHPRWKMGRKITIDSATLMNKGLEVIEARWLFGLEPGRISVVIHPQSIVHSMVEYVDSSIVAQLGNPDMKGPIAYALSYPERIEAGTPTLSFAGLDLSFSEPEPERFPCLSLAYSALEAGGLMPAVLNAADEVAVEAFLKGSIGFTDIFRVIDRVMDATAKAEGGVGNPTSIEEVIDADSRARARATETLAALY